MKINFRQGLIGFQQDNSNPVYLQPSSTSGFVSHVVSPTPTIAAFAHGESDYLVKFENTTDLAWQITAPVTAWLYWDVDQLTSAVTRGITILIPITSMTEPVAPADDQHWFDLNSTLMKVWSAARNKWMVKIRLFAGQVVNGNVGQIIQYGAGSQIGLTTPSNPGYIMLDTMLQPLKKSTLNGEFLTDEDEARVLTTVGTSGVLVQPVNRVIPVRAGEPIPRMSMVYFSDEDTIRLATSDPGLIPSRPPVGICMDALASGEVGTVTIGGEVTYDQWDWSSSPGAPVYSDSYGALTLTRPPGLMAFRVGFIKNRNTVLVHVDSETSPSVYTVNTNDLVIAGQTPVTTTDVVNGLGERVVTIIVPDATLTQRGLMTAAQHVMLDGHETRITTAEGNITGLQASKANVVHTHVMTDVTDLAAAMALKSNVGHLHTEYAPVLHAHTEYAPAIHGHSIPDVAGLQVELNQRSFRQHLNAISEIYSTVDRTGGFDVGMGQTLTDILAGKAAVSHTHLIADVSGLNTTLTALQNDINNRAFISHTHPISAVSGLQSALDGKAAVAHSHNVGDLLDVTLSATQAGDVLTFDGASTWQNQQPAAYLFQVGAPMLDHQHYAVMSQADARFMIMNTSPSLAVADVSQPSVVLTTIPNGSGPHTHDITVFFDYVNHTFMVTNITNNALDNHYAFVVGDGSGSGSPLSLKSTTVSFSAPPLA